jgi:toxin ParE1/3/4
MAEIIKSDRAKEDLIEIADWLEINGGWQLAERFLEAAEYIFGLLAVSPFIGRQVEIEGVDVGPLRRFGIQGFANHLIFYVPLDNGCEIIRIVYGGRDLRTILFNTKES